jgi:hypothetical protein
MTATIHIIASSHNLLETSSSKTQKMLEENPNESIAYSMSDRIMSPFTWCTTCRPQFSAMHYLHLPVQYTWATNKQGNVFLKTNSTNMCWKLLLLQFLEVCCTLQLNYLGPLQTILLQGLIHKWHVAETCRHNYANYSVQLSRCPNAFKAL